MKRYSMGALGALSALAAMTALGLARPAAADPCDGYTWNVAHERAVFATHAAAVTAASAGGTVPLLEADRLYDIALAPQSGVSYVMKPQKKALPDGAYGGLVHLHIPAAGQYRVSMDVPFWIDVIADHRFAPTTDFTGMRGCKAPHKIVQFPLPAGDDLVLQFSGAASAHVHVTITAAPPGAPSPAHSGGMAPAKDP
ncbi:MAG TPA: hypothetical protein VMB48_10330 [Steroidobacteraceae bacterium]|nr:hypothetical protein [Steroidobacteraceae bacterium]